MATEKRLMCVDEFKKNLCHYCNIYMSEEPCEPGECWVYDVIAQTGSVDAVEVVHGRNLNEDWPSLFECSVCGCNSIDTYSFEPSTINFCPNCGAKMDGDGNG